MATTFTINIDGTNYTSFLSYPITKHDTRLNESLNLIEFELKWMSLDTSIKPNKELLISIYQDSTLKNTEKYWILSDRVERVGTTNYYNHSITAIENIYILSQKILPDMTITRIEGVYEPTLKIVVQKIMSLGNATRTLTMNAANILDNVLSPEWTFTRMTVLEALRLVISMVQGVPYLDADDKLDILQISSTDAAAAIDNYTSRTNVYDPETYKTALYSNVSNFIAGDTRSIVEPANGWMTPRSPENNLINSDNATIKISRPVYKINSLLVKPSSFAIKGLSGTTFDWTIVDYDLINKTWITNKELTNLLYEKKVYDSLENIQELNQKGGSLYYTQNGSEINGLTYIPPKPSWLSNPTKQSIRYILGDGIASPVAIPISNIDDYIDPIYFLSFENFMLNAFYAEYSYTPTVYTLFAWFEGWTGLSNGSVLGEIEIESLEFKVEYIPYINTNLYTYKERKTENEEETFQYYNQTANVISNRVLADLHDKVIKRGTGDTIEHKILNISYDDIAATSHRVGDYIITEGHHTLNGEDIFSTYTLDKYYAKLQKNVAVLEKYRQFSIPDEGIVSRQITINKFAKFSSSPSSNSSNLNLSLYLGTQDIDVVKLYGLDYIFEGFLFPTSFSFNNSIVIEAQLPTQAELGRESVDFDETGRLEKPYIYTDENGQINGMAIWFYTNFPEENWNIIKSHMMPTSSETSIVFDNNDLLYTDAALEIFKDSRERIGFSLQLHHIDTTGKVYINAGFAALNGLVGGKGLNNNDIKLAFLNIKPHSKRFLSAGDIIQSTTHNFSYNIFSNNIELGRTTNTSSTAMSWAIIDSSNNEVLFWVDEEVESMALNSLIYINFSNTY